MPRSKPYQTLLLRFFHGLNALLIIGAAITGFLVYDSWDGRFGKLALTIKDRGFIDIHGTFGFFLSFIALPLFAFYIFIAGRNRLIQGNTLQKLTELGKPIWWYTLQRIANTLMLLAAIFAVISGKFQDEDWLPNGEFNHIWYYIHLIAWVSVVIALAIHLLMSIKTGGIPLLLSMFDTKYRPADSPKLWGKKFLSLFRRTN